MLSLFFFLSSSLFNSYNKKEANLKIPTYPESTATSALGVTTAPALPFSDPFSTTTINVPSAYTGDEGKKAKAKTKKNRQASQTAEGIEVISSDGHSSNLDENSDKKKSKGGGGRRKKGASNATTSTLAKQKRDDKAAEFRKSIGLSALPQYQVLELPVAELLVLDSKSISSQTAERFARSINLVGVLNPPAVVPIAIDNEGHLYKVLLGRRRVTAALAAGLKTITCHVYSDELTSAQQATLRLSENLKRSSYAVGEILDLRELLKTTLVTEKELAAHLGLSLVTVKKRLKIAQLPLPLLEALSRGEINLAIAERIAGLPLHQQEELAEQAELGEELTLDQVILLRKNQKDKELSPIGQLFELDEEMSIARTTGRSKGVQSTPPTAHPNESRSSSITPFDLTSSTPQLSLEEIKETLQKLVEATSSLSGRAARQVNLLVSAALIEAANLENR